MWREGIKLSQESQKPVVQDNRLQACRSVCEGAPEGDRLSPPADKDR